MITAVQSAFTAAGFWMRMHLPQPPLSGFVSPQQPSSSPTRPESRSLIAAVIQSRSP
jgi:hypothetical protein